MKKTVLTFVTLCFLLGAPSRSVATSNPMVDMMVTMMEMFLWMMGDKDRYRGYGGSPYGLGGYGNPYTLGYPAMPWGSAYSSYGSMFSPYAGYPGFGALGTNALNPYTYPAYGNQLYNRQNYSNLYNPYSRYGSPYSNNYRWPYRNPPVVLQPIIIDKKTNKAKPPAVTKQKRQVKPPTATKQKPQVKPRDTFPPVPLPRATIDPRPRQPSADTGTKRDNPIEGAWYGVNGEYLELGSESFRMLAGEDYLEGYYEVSNGIMKVKLLNQDDPAYFMIRFRHRELVFESEDGQLMLFRSMGPAEYTYAPGTYTPPLNKPRWR